MRYNVISNIQTDSNSDFGIEEEYYDFVDDIYIDFTELRIYKDSTILGIYINEDYYNGQLYHTELNTNESVKINWAFENSILFYDNFEENDNFVLSTLSYVFDKFFTPKDITFNGNILLYNFEEDMDADKCECIYYNIKNSQLIYHINKSIDYTSHWKNCNIYFNGGEVIDIYPRVNLQTYATSFENYMHYYVQDLHRLGPLELFEESYHRI